MRTLDSQVEASIHPVLHKEDMTSAEKDAYWLCRLDWLRIEEDIRNDMMLAAWKNRRRHSYEPDPSRGIEWKTREGSQKRMEVHKKSVFAVLAEQRRQRMFADSKVDEEHLAFIYRSLALNSQRSAQTIAAQDERGVVEDPDYETFKRTVESQLPTVK